MSDFVTLWTVAYQAPLGFSRQNTRVGYHSLLQGIFPTQGLNLCLLHCRWIPYGYDQRRSRVTISSVQSQSCPTLCNPMNPSTPGFPIHHQLPELTQTHVHQVGDSIQPSHPLSSPSLPALNLSQHQGIFQCVNSPCDVAKVLELQLQHQSFQ